MTGKLPWGWMALAGLTAVLLLVTLRAIFVVAPVEAQMGIVQKVFYFHVPSAYGMYIGFCVCMLGSAIYLARGARQDLWNHRAEALAVAGAEIGTLFCLMVLISGPLWARKAWGVYWTWDPRLTSTMLAGMVYVAYLVLRSGGGEGERKFAAALGLLGGPLCLVIHYSVQRWRGQHPTVITSKGGGLEPEMLTALLLGFASFTALAALFIWARASLELDRQGLEEARLDAAEAGLLEE